MGVIRDDRVMLEPREDVIVRSYNEIVRLLCRKNVAPDKFELVKNKFRNDINSSRRFSCIGSLEQLIQILERRCIINCFTISKLFEIAEIVGIDNQIGTLLNFQSQLLSKYRPSQTQFLFDMSLLSDSAPTLPDSVIEHISSSLGTSWKEFARALYIIREETLDKIDENSCDNDEKTRQMLLTYLQEAKIQRLLNPYKVLLESLEKIRRRDVKERVEELLTENMANSSS